MLVLSRKSEETILIGQDIVVRVLKVSGSTVKLGIEAPRQTTIKRAELLGDESATAGWELQARE